jgi:hypothetical protein
MKHARWFALVLTLALCVTPVPACPDASAQGVEPTTFRKPAWGLTLFQPFEWTVRDNEESFVTFVYEDTDDNMVFVLARDRKWANPKYSLENTFDDILAEVGATAEDPVIEPAGALRTLAGGPARVARFTAFDPESGHDIAGYVIAFVANNEAYGVIAGSYGETWPAHRVDVDRVLRSIRVGAAPPEQVASTEEARPTEGPAPTPRATPSGTAATFISAREAVAEALPIAQQWKPGAILCEMQCYGEGDAEGRCRNWRVDFAPGTDASSEAYTVVIEDGQVDPLLSSRDPLHDRALPPEGWLDSVEVMPTFLDNGGAGFLERHPHAKINLTLRERILSPDYSWEIEAIDGTWSGPGASYVAEIDPLQNTVDASPQPANEVTKYYTAREALATAQKAMRKYPDAKMTEMFGSVQVGEKGYEAARSGYWVFYFHWDELAQGAERMDVEHRGYSLTLSDGKIKDADFSDYHPDPEVTGEWGDSPAALETFQASTDYQAFAELFADPGWSFVLGGDEKLGSLWKVSAELNGVRLEERFTLPAS